MRGNQEAFILVKVKDGQLYVCALNRPKSTKDDEQAAKVRQSMTVLRDVIWN